MRFPVFLLVLLECTQHVVSATCGPKEFAVEMSLEIDGMIGLRCESSPCYLDNQGPSDPRTCTTMTETSCSGGSELVGGIENDADIFMPLKLICCTSKRLVGSERIGLAVASRGSFWRGGEVRDDNNRLLGFDIIKNLRRDIDANGDVALVAEISRLQCTPPPEITKIITKELLIHRLPPLTAFGIPLQCCSPMCFAKDVTVETVSGSKTMEKIQVGDSVLSVVNNKAAFVRVTSFIHRLPDQPAKFQKIVTSDSNDLTLTPYHFLFVTSCNSETRQKQLGTKVMKYAKDVIPGKDCLLQVGAGGGISEAEVLNNSVIYERGIFSPMTENGVIVTNGYMSSCHSHMKNNGVMTTVMYWLQKIQRSLGFWFNSGSTEQETVEIPWPITFALKSAEYILDVSSILPTKE